MDSDFDYLRRHEVIDYLRDKYGRNHVAKIGTYTTMSSRMALKDAGRVMEFDPQFMNEVTSHIPNLGGSMPLDEAIETIPQVREMSKKFPDLFDLARDLEGMPRSTSQHASGVIVTPGELDRSIPLQTAAGEVVTQYDGETLEEIGYIKVLN